MLGLCAVVALAQGGFCAAHLWVSWVVGNLIDRSDFHDFEEVELGLWVLFTLHNQHVFEALVIVATVQSWAVAQTVELVVFESFSNRTRCEGASTGYGICIEQGLHVSCVSSLGRREAVLGAEGTNECLRAFVLQS